MEDLPRSASPSELGAVGPDVPRERAAGAHLLDDLNAEFGSLIFVSDDEDGVRGNVPVSDPQPEPEYYMPTPPCFYTGPVHHYHHYHCPSEPCGPRAAPSPPRERQRPVEAERVAFAVHEATSTALAEVRGSIRELFSEVDRVGSAIAHLLPRRRERSPTTGRGRDRPRQRTPPPPLERVGGRLPSSPPRRPRSSPPGSPNHLPAVIPRLYPQFSDEVRENTRHYLLFELARVRELYPDTARRGLERFVSRLVGAGTFASEDQVLIAWSIAFAQPAKAHFYELWDSGLRAIRASLPESCSIRLNDLIRF